MERIWEFFENMDEMVYAADVQTHELVYMNQYLRQSLGYTDPAEYAGRKCYEVLQGMDRPCTFCNNFRLRTGEFVTWAHHNPILHKSLLLKDTVLSADGRRCRLEIAIDVDAERSCHLPHHDIQCSAILNECIQKIFSSANPEESIQRMLDHIGHSFACDRSYIFEATSNQLINNTHEWCAEGVKPQKDLLQNVPRAGFEWWFSLFADNKVTVIHDLEAIRTEYPEAYGVLKPQGIQCLAVGPIKNGDEVIGFIGVDNPNPAMMPAIESLLMVIGYFTSTLISQREMLSRLHNLSYRDQMTGAYNRHALEEMCREPSMYAVGVIYCDIIGLKQVNDAGGHAEGDQLIRRCCDLLRQGTGTKLLYRTAGDEFVALCPNCSAVEFHKILQHTRELLRAQSCVTAFGHIWTEEQPLDLEGAIFQAEQAMYEDKRICSRARRHGQQDTPEHTVTHYVSEQPQTAPAVQEEVGEANETAFQSFLRMSNYDTEALFQSVSQDNESSYFYLGDMQSDLFYISDNMREDFGFSGNLVPGLLKQWAKRISSPEYQDLYWQDISGMLREKRTVHDLRYRVRDVRGNNQWVRCYGILKWNKGKTKPLFFSGRVTHQDASFVVDPVMGFPREHASFQQLEDLRKNGEKSLVIGFSLNGITEVNSTRGREAGDRLLKEIGNALLESLSWKMSFYRLDGMRCMAVVNPMCMEEGRDSFVQQIRSIIEERYAAMGLAIKNVCSIGVIEYPFGELAREDLAETLVSLIRVAKQEATLPYVDYSNQNIQRIKQMFNLSLVLREDVANDMRNFRIVVQPVVSAKSGKPVGGEVLLRWRQDGRDISPGIFIPILESDGLIQGVGRWVFEQAVCTCMRLRAHNPNFYLTFNVSLHQLADTLFLPFMHETLQKYGMDGSGLVAELTESALDEQPAELERFVEGCHRMQLRIALDDFGSGYSSLRMLLQYPLSIIKLDQSLVRETTESAAKMHFIRSIVYACHEFGKTVCVEGVEQADQDEIIRNTGCDLIQGYYYYRPMELSDVYGLLSRLTGSPQQAGQEP